ncbi:hypothetical protein AVEN_29617-1 [Araneus ventricosus]|nr:hypothetical protein AVEN_29617-1 [Araneus ventricosus]
MWILNSNENLKFRKTETSEIDEVLMKWFRSARAKNIPVSDVLLQEKAREVGESLRLETFKASNGWLEKFRTRHNISFKQICGEEKSVNPNEVTDWIGKLKSLLKGYDDRDIFNAVETDSFTASFRTRPYVLRVKNVVALKLQKSGSLVCCVSTCWETSKLQLLLEKLRSPDASRTLMNENVEEYVKIDEDLSTEEENLHVSNFIHWDITEALALSEDDDEESPMEDCKIKDYSKALKYSEQLKQFFLNNEDSEGLTKLNLMKIHLEKQVCCVKKINQT